MWVIDFEASGLSRQSYPIEVGITNGSDGYQSLIRPLPHWRHWSVEAEGIHTLSRSRLESEGDTPDHVALTLNQKLCGEVAYCDSLRWDEFWCNVLFSDCSISRRFEVRDIRELFNGSDEQLEAYITTRSQLEVDTRYIPHRALDDATVIWHSLKTAIK